jgi:hypothetical protein
VTDDAQTRSMAASEQPTQVTPGAAAPPPPPPMPPPPPPPPVIETAPPAEPPVTEKVAALIDERPEIGAGGAFVGGIVFALILKRLGR